MFASHPEVPTNLFGRLGGRFLLRIFARNLVGVGPYSEILVNLSGDLPLMEVPEAEISSEFLDQMHTTFFVEYFFFSDHQDAPKVKLLLLLHLFCCVCVWVLAFVFFFGCFKCCNYYRQC